MSDRGIRVAKWAGALAGAALLAIPALADSRAEAKRRPPAISISIDRVGSFTPATADPKLAAALANRSSSLGDFKFTPAAPKGRPSQVRVAIRAAAVSARPAGDATAQAAIAALTPASYNLGMSVGWRRFAVTGDVGKTRTGSLALGGRETAIVGVNYSISRKLTGRVAASAERSDESRAPALGREEGYAVDVGGAYSLNRRLAVTGGVRYKVDRERDAALKDDRRDSQAVYLGTAFKF